MYLCIRVYIYIRTYMDICKNNEYMLRTKAAIGGKTGAGKKSDRTNGNEISGRRVLRRLSRTAMYNFLSQSM